MTEKALFHSVHNFFFSIMISFNLDIARESKGYITNSTTFMWGSEIVLANGMFIEMGNIIFWKLYLKYLSHTHFLTPFLKHVIAGVMDMMGSYA